MSDPRIVNISGVFPHLVQTGDLGPPRSEAGIGGLMPWNGKLYAITYVSHRRKTGLGTGLRVIDENLNMITHPESVPGTYANRFIHYESNQMIIGPHIIDASHNVRTIKDLTEIRLTGTCKHLKDPENLVYMLGMEGELFELNVHTLAVKQIADLTHELKTQGENAVHFKCMYSCFGKLVVGNNDYHEPDFQGTRDEGRLAEWDGEPGHPWKIIERKPFVEVTGRGGFGGTMFATGWDRASAILMVYTDANKTWTRYRLPKASHTFDHKWQTEWPRIRETEHERFLMDHHGMFYELSPWAYSGRVWGIRPISTHLWVMGDFCSWRGMLVLGSDNASPSGGRNALCAEPQSGLWFGKTDDLWQFGKPSGWGGPWWDTPVKANEPSDPYLMTGFEHKCLHASHNSSSTVRFDIEVDFLGNGSWKPYAQLAVEPGGYAYHVFPTGFSAHWVRAKASVDCVATVQLTYT